MEIIVQSLKFSYKEHIVLNDLELRVAAGERIGIIGQSGCGKSTLLKFLSGLYEDKMERVIVSGETKADTIRKKTAMVMQNPMLLPATIRENIHCGHPMEEAWIRQVCEAARLTEWIKTLPQGLDTYLGDRGNELSGGQAQRIAIARAMAKNANVILLDEATSALDYGTSKAVMEAIGQLTKGKTVVHVAHQVELLKEYDHIYRMEGGKLYEA